MRKIVGLIAIFLAFFLCVHGVISYTNATLENQAVLNITDPVNGLVSLVPIDDPLFIRQGEDKEALYVANNLDTPISYVLEYQHDYLSMKQPDNGFLYPGEISYITLSVADSCPTGDITLPVTLQADLMGAVPVLKPIWQFLWKAAILGPGMMSQAMKNHTQMVTMPI